MRTFRAFRVALCLVVGAVGLTATAAAQSNDEVFPALEWNFSTPGARANGMGRSFIGLADDATAAVTNPAGLVSLTRPQFYLEFKNTTLEVDRLAAVDSLFTLQPTTFKSTAYALSFLSLSAPLNDKIAVGFSVHRSLDHHEAFSLSARRIPNDPGGFTFFPVAGGVDFIATKFGGSIAYQVTRAIRVGVTIAGTRLEADSVARRQRFDTNLVTSNIVVNETSIHDTQNAISASLGALYKANEKVSVGFNYERGPRFNTSENLQSNSGSLNSLALSTNQPLTTVAGFPKDVAIKVPDHFGVGVAIRPTPRSLIAADVVRVQYSSLSENTTRIFEATQLSGNEYVTPDVSELHVGGEYQIFNVRQKHPVFVRGGVFTNPSHRVRFAGAADASTNASEAAKYNLLAAKDETRGTVGGGVVFGARFQADVAYVFGKEVVASTAVRF